MSDSLRLQTTTDLDVHLEALIQENYGIKISERQLLSGGLINSNWWAGTNAGDVVVRIYPRGSDPERATFEALWLSVLNRRGIKVPAVLQMLNGDSVLQTEFGILILEEYIVGDAGAPENCSMEVLTEVGSEMGKIHTVARSYVNDLPSRDCGITFVDELLGQSIDVLERAGRQADAKQVREFTSKFINVGYKRSQNSCEQTLIHADLYDENILVKDGHLTGVLDFDDAYIGCAVDDFAISLTEFGMNDMLEVLSPRIFAFMRGYAAVSSVPTWGAVENSVPEQFIRFLAHTLPLTVEGEESLQNNDYWRRLEAWQSGTLRDDLQLAFESSIDALG